MRNEFLGECRFLMDHADDSRFLQPRDDGVRHGRDCRDTPRLPGKTSLAEELVRSKNGDDGFLALLGNNGELHFALLDVKDRICRVSLRKDHLVLAVLTDAAAVADFGKK